MFPLGKRRKNNGFLEKHEHSVMPSLDYQFAKEFYEPSDSRYKLVKAFENLIWEAKNIQIYNCKIEIVKTTDNLFNVYLYFCDLKKTFGEDFNPFFNKDKDFIVLFNKALKEYSVEELKGKKLNPNGIFVEDFLRCARCYAISNASKAFETSIKEHYPAIEFVTFWDETIYLFFHDHLGLEDFIKGDIVTFKKFCYDIIKPFDVENVWEVDNLAVMLDKYENYRSIGGRNYFNSDTMSAGVFI
jgi:hypothetical protein